MKTVDTKVVIDRFGKILIDSQLEPIGIQENDQVVSVILSKKEYERLAALDDVYWGELALESAKEGFIGPEESMKFIQSKLHETIKSNTPLS